MMLTGLISILTGTGIADPLSAGVGRELALVVVEAGPHDRVHTPIVIPTSGKILFGQDMPTDRLARQCLVLVDLDGPSARGVYPAQWQAVTDPPMSAVKTGALVFTLPGKTPANSVRRFQLRTVERRPGRDRIAVEDDKGKALLFRCGGRSIARYNYGLVQRQPGKPSMFDRTAYFHPVWAPCGQIVTDDFPKSHPHQRGLFLAWTRATIGGYKADFWNLLKRRGKTLHRRLDHVVGGPVFGGFIAYNECVANGRVAIKETWVTRIYAGPMGVWLIDLDVRHTATDQPVVLEKYHYGGVAYRGRPDWLKRNRPQIEASDGYDAKKGATESARWVDMAGKLPGGHDGGLTMIDHPSNPTYPTAARIHTDKPYFCFAFAQRGPYTIEAGKSLELRYRCVVHDGPPDRNANDRWAADFADPPTVTIRPVSQRK